MRQSSYNEWTQDDGVKVSFQNNLQFMSLAQDNDFSPCLRRTDASLLSLNPQIQLYSELLGDKGGKQVPRVHQGPHKDPGSENLAPKVSQRSRCAGAVSNRAHSVPENPVRQILYDDVDPIDAALMVRRPYPKKDTPSFRSFWGSVFIGNLPGLPGFLLLPSPTRSNSRSTHSESKSICDFSLLISSSSSYDDDSAPVIALTDFGNPWSLRGHSPFQWPSIPQWKQASADCFCRGRRNPSRPPSGCLPPANVVVFCASGETKHAEPPRRRPIRLPESSASAHPPAMQQPVPP